MDVVCGLTAVTLVVSLLMYVYWPEAEVDGWLTDVGGPTFARLNREQAAQSPKADAELGAYLKSRRENRQGTVQIKNVSGIAQQFVVQGLPSRLRMQDCTLKVACSITFRRVVTLDPQGRGLLQLKNGAFIDRIRLYHQGLKEAEWNPHVSAGEQNPMLLTYGSESMAVTFVVHSETDVSELSVSLIHHKLRGLRTYRESTDGGRTALIERVLPAGKYFVVACGLGHEFVVREITVDARRGTVVLRLPSNPSYDELYKLPSENQLLMNKILRPLFKRLKQ